MLRPRRAVRPVLAAFAALAFATTLAPAGDAVHFFRGGAGTGCTEATGATGDPASGLGGATVMMLHNTFNDAATGAPVTRITAGQSVTWKWASLHCHSVTQGLANMPAAGGFTSGYHYPAQTGSLPPGPSFFVYPVPELSPTYSYTETFSTPGTYTYYCVHHWAIGMQGAVIVEPA